MLEAVEKLTKRKETGTLLSLNATVTGNVRGRAVTTTGLGKTTCSVKSGDSGGIVYSATREVLGIIKSYEPATGNSYFVLANNIKNTLNIEPY